MEIIPNFIINNSKKILIALISIIVLICAYLFISYKINFLYNIVVKNRNKWEIFSTQNGLMSGNYMGIIYEKDYDVNNMPSDLVSMLFVDYYIDHKIGFYSENNLNSDNSLYSVTLTKEEVEETKKALFGPDYNIDLETINYGCKRSLKKVGDTYEITSQDSDMCRLFISITHNYISHISSYKKEGKDIIINLKVAYIEEIFDNQGIETEPISNEDFYDETLNENEEKETTNYDEEDDSEEYKYKAYTDKTKKALIDGDYPQKCIYEEDEEGTCYNEFPEYQVTLKKASDGKYYFYEIKKQ